MISIKRSVLISALFFSGCTTVKAPELTPLQIQSLQTREYEQSKDIVFPSVISVFQDLGYTIKNADKETGLISAESTAKSDASYRILLGVSKVTQTSATAFIERIGKVTKVRLNFVTSDQRSYAQGQSDREDTAILDAQIYQNAFERIESAIFIRSAA